MFVLIQYVGIYCTFLFPENIVILQSHYLILRNSILIYEVDQKLRKIVKRQQKQETKTREHLTWSLEPGLEQGRHQQRAMCGELPRWDLLRAKLFEPFAQWCSVSDQRQGLDEGEGECSLL